MPWRLGAWVLPVAAVIAMAPAPRSALAADRGHVDVDVVNADVRDVIRLFADVGHVNVVVSDDVSGTITLRLKNVLWNVALETVLAAKGLAMQRRGNVLLVTKA
jgi:type IV pilus assembly protein PilQ